MPWHSIRGHDRVVESLRESLAQGRLPHAFLFVGPEGIGKRTFARTFARALLCERAADRTLDPCGVCPGCLQVEAGAHPDLLEVRRPEDKHELPIKVIRDLCIDLGMKPARGTRKVAIVDDADDLNDEAANAFLKTLEEPPPGSALILIGTSAEVQLDTIVSRCRVVRFEPLSESDLAAAHARFAFHLRGSTDRESGIVPCRLWRSLRRNPRHSGSSHGRNRNAEKHSSAAKSPDRARICRWHRCHRRSQITPRTRRRIATGGTGRRKKRKTKPGGGSGSRRCARSCGATRCSPTRCRRGSTR